VPYDGASNPRNAVHILEETRELKKSSLSGVGDMQDITIKGLIPDLGRRFSARPPILVLPETLQLLARIHSLNPSALPPKGYTEDDGRMSVRVSREYRPV
jgi:hypothetical protein